MGACDTPLLTCFPSGAGGFELVQHCGLADFIPIYTLSFDPGNQVINEWNKNLHLTLEQHHRFSLELFLWQPENLHLSQIPFKLQKGSHISMTTMQSGHLFLRGKWRYELRLSTQDGWGEFFLPIAGLIKISFCLLPSLNLKSYCISLNNPTL